MAISHSRAVCGLLAASGLLILLALVGCGEIARLPLSVGIGAHPTLPPPNQSLIPTLTFNMATAKPRPNGAMPTTALSTLVAAFVGDLHHPRLNDVLPDGVVLTGFLSNEGNAFGRQVAVALDKMNWRVSASL